MLDNREKHEGKGMPKDMSEQVLVLESNIQIERENYSKLIEVMKELMSKAQEQGSSAVFWTQNPDDTIQQYAGVDTSKALEYLGSEDLEDGIWCFFEQWGYLFEVTSVGLQFEGGWDPEIGQWGIDDHYLFRALAGVVSPGSYIRFQEGPSDLWGYSYTEEGLREEQGDFKWVAIPKNLPTPIEFKEVQNG